MSIFRASLPMALNDMMRLLLTGGAVFCGPRTPSGVRTSRLPRAQAGEERMHSLSDMDAQSPASTADESPFTAEGLPRTLWWDASLSALRLIDQTRLPLAVEVLTCHDARTVGEAIRTLQVRGAPAIGVAAAFGLALGAREARLDDTLDGETALA